MSAFAFSGRKFSMIGEEFARLSAQTSCPHSENAQTCLRVLAHEGDCLTLTIQRNLLADDVEFIAEVSPDLVTWTEEASLIREILNGDGTATVTFKWDSLIPDHPAYFIRLRVNQVAALL